MRFNALIQTDQDIFLNTKGVTINTGVSSQPITNRETVDRIWIRRARPVLSGHLLTYNDFFIQPDFGQGQSRLFDAFLDIHYIDWLAFSAGKQISLIAGIEQLNDQAAVFSMEPGYPTIMAPNREIGFMIHGEWASPNSPKHANAHGFDSWLSYQIGLFSGTADSTNPGLNPVSTTAFSSENATLEDKGLEMRVFTNPFKNTEWAALKGLGFGMAGGFDHPNNQAQLPSILSVGQNPIFDYVQTIVANGSRYRIHPQGYWFIGSFGVVADWAHTSQQLLSQAQNNINTATLQRVIQHNSATEVQMIYNLTGETSRFATRLTPLTPFELHHKGAWGALQLVGRWSSLHMDPNVFNSYQTNQGETTYTFSDPRVAVSQAHTWSIGFNWFLNQYVSMTTEYDQTHFIGGCSTGAMSATVNPGCLTSSSSAINASTSQVLNRADEKIIMQRIQFHY